MCTLDTEEVQSGGKETFDGITGLAAEEATSCLCVERYINGITRWRGFGQQLDFIDILTEMVRVYTIVMLRLNSYAYMFWCYICYTWTSLT